MTQLPAPVHRSMLLRSLTVQGSWNYETLIGTGFAFTLLPALRSVYRDDPEALREAVCRHADVFNSHPYLATVAVGAVATLEAERVEPQVIDRFKNALRGSLGSLGDQLVWRAWRPASMLLALVLLLAGAAWWVAVGAFLLVYNALHLPLRAWGLRVGLRAGRGVGRVLREAPLQDLARRAGDAGALLAGAAAALVAVPLEGDFSGAAVAAAAVGAGLWLGPRTRTVAVAAVGGAWAIAILLGLIH